METSYLCSNTTLVITMDNFMCPLDHIKRDQIAGKILVWGVSVRVFLEEDLCLISRLNEDGQPSPIGVGIT